MSIVCIICLSHSIADPHWYWRPNIGKYVRKLNYNIHDLIITFSLGLLIRLWAFKRNQPYQSRPTFWPKYSYVCAVVSNSLIWFLNRPQIEPNHERASRPAHVNQTPNHSQVFPQNEELPLQKSNDIYQRHLVQKDRGFPLWIPDTNRVLHLDYRRTGVRIGDVGIITHDGAFSFIFNICLPHDNPINPRMLPERFAPISPPIEATDIESFVVFKHGSHLASGASIKKSQTSPAVSWVSIFIHISVNWEYLQWNRFRIICFWRCDLDYATRS